MANPVLYASLVTVVPGMVALWWFLRRYEGILDEPRVFFSLILGFFAGLAAAAFEFFTDFGGVIFAAAAGTYVAAAFFILGYPFFEAGIKTMALGLRRFRGRKDTAFYGLAFGLGMGSMLAMMVLANASRRAEEAGNPYTIPTFLGLAAVGVGAMLTHGATAVWVGKGVGDGKMWKGWGMATLLQTPSAAVLWFLWPFLGSPLSGLNLVVPAALALGYGFVLVRRADASLLQPIVPHDVRMQLRREARRRALGLDSEE